jgi:hypothetical protein
MQTTKELGDYINEIKGRFKPTPNKPENPHKHRSLKQWLKGDVQMGEEPSRLRKVLVSIGEKIEN